MAQRKEETEKPNYYAVIPASVRYDSKLPKGAILLYGEITALSHKDGTSWASNSYFARLYKVDSTTIQRWLMALENRGYINRKVVYKRDKKTVDRRYIHATIVPDYPTAKMRSGGNNDGTPTGTSEEDVPHRKNEVTPPPQKRGHPHRKNEAENNTSINNKTPLVVQVIQYLNQKTGKRFSAKARANSDLIKARVNEAGYTLEDFKTVIDNKTAEWQGKVTSSGTPMTAYLKPSTLFSKKHFDDYLNAAPVKQPHSEPLASKSPEDELRRYVVHQSELYGGLSAQDAAARIVNELAGGETHVDQAKVMAIVNEYRKAGETSGNSQSQ